MNTDLIIGISGNARSGKDTFCQLALSFLSDKKVAAARVAFADQIKRDLDKLCRHNIGCSAFTDDEEEKALIRPLLVAYGTNVIRKINEDWWIERLEKNMPLYTGADIVPIITDVRYPNERKWIKDKGGVCVHVTREGVGPANTEEKKNNVILLKKADYTVSWPTFGADNVSEGKPYIAPVMTDIFTTKIQCQPQT